MTILRELCVSGGTDVMIPTVELTCAAWVDSVAICGGYESHTVVTEDSRTVEMLATGLRTALPNRDATSAQSLVFSLGNLHHQVTLRVRQALDQQQDVALTYRTYLLSDLSAPAEPPLHLSVRQVQTRNGRADVTAALFDLIDTKWPRVVFDSNNAPGASSF